MEGTRKRLLTPEEKEANREKHRLRMEAYRDRKKAEKHLRVELRPIRVRCKRVTFVDEVMDVEEFAHLIDEVVRAQKAIA